MTPKSTPKPTKIHPKSYLNIYLIYDQCVDHLFIDFDYKLKLKAYSKRRFDPFCRWDRIAVPLEKGGDTSIETTIGQLNFFKWTLENEVIDFIETNYEAIEKDMNSRNSTSRRKQDPENVTTTAQNKTRKRREELSISAVKTIKKEEVEIVVEFN